MPINNIPNQTYPLTMFQLGIYFEHMRNPQTLKYNIAIMCHLPEGTVHDRFADAIKTVIDRHPVFHTVIREVNGTPSMCISANEIPLDILQTSDFDAQIDNIRRPYDLENGPLCRFALLNDGQKQAFLFSVHHLIFDGISLNVFLHQIAAVYDGNEIPDEDMTLMDEAMRLTEPKDPEIVKGFSDFFEKQLGDIDSDSRLQSDILVENDDESAGCVTITSENILTPKDVTDYILPRRLTENALFLAAFGYMLAKFNGTSQSFFATGHNGRFDKRLSSTIGYFVRMLPFVCRFNEDMTPEELIRTASDDYYTAKKNDCIALSELSDKYGFAMDASIVYHSTILESVSMKCGSININLLEEAAPVTPLEFMVSKLDSCFEFRVVYSKKDYSEALIRTLIRSLISVAAGMLKADKLSDLSLIDDEDVRLIDSFNHTEAPYPADRTVIDLFREQVKKTPDADCVVYTDRHYTYRETDEITDRLAKHLRTLGVKKDSVTGILIPRCEYMVLAALGVLKAGGAYMPLDPGYPAERLNLMMKDSGAELLITTPDLSNVISDEYTGERLMTDCILSLPDPEIPLPIPKPDDRFVLLYTSGSTGKPKGVLFAHSNTMVSCYWGIKYNAYDSGSRIAVYASYGFDANVFDTYPALISGAALHIIEEDIRLDMLELQKYFNDNGITHAVMTTQVGRQYALMGGHKTLKMLAVAGEKLTPLTPPDGLIINNHYGPTEGSILATTFRIDKLYKDVPIGKAIDNVKLYVTDPQGRMLPPGAAGELWIVGPHVTMGYLNRPEKTTEVYIANPFPHDKGYERVYRTGDIVRYLHDGNIQFIGRRDGMVKVRGFRIELTEVEEVIRRFPGIHDATVAAFDDPVGGKYLAAYVVSDQTIDIAAMNDFIRSEKPYYMVPAVTMQIDRIPLNQNMKVNRRALPLPERKTEKVNLPETELQSRIYELLCEILGHRDFGIDTNLFDAGLTSIGTLKLNMALGKTFHVPVRLDDLKQNDTVLKLEALIAASTAEEQYEVLPHYPITRTQQGIFIESSRTPNSITYNIPLLMKLSPELDLDRLTDAVKAALDAHPYTKAMLFADAQGEIRVRRNDDLAADVRRIRTATLPDESDLIRPHTLLNAPLYRAAIYETENGNYLFLDFHHIISDGTSEAVLLKDISRAYMGETLVKESYTGFEAALDEEKARTSDRYAKAKAYYDSVFSGCETECLPPAVADKDHAGSVSVKKVFRTKPEDVRLFCEKHRLTPNALFNAAFGYTLSRFAPIEDAVFTTIYSGRSDSRLASAFTMLVKTLPVLIHIDKDDSVVGLVRRTQEQLMNSMSNDVYSFAEIARNYGIRSDILFVYQGDMFRFDELGGKPAEMIDIVPAMDKAPITISVFLTNDRYELDIDYRADRYSAAFMDSFLNALDMAVSGFLNAAKPVEVSLCDDSALRRLHEINDTKRDFDNIPVCRMFEREVAKHPDQMAVIASGRKLTFDETNRLANRIAHVLISEGVKKDTIVGILLDRTAEIPYAELGILKAGGAFLGLLPSYPDDRLEFCLTDSACPIVITTQELKTAHAALFAPGKPYRVMTVDELLRETDDSNPDIDIPMDSLAYCIYTSGSTGKPKGVMIEQHNLVCCAQPADFPYTLYIGSLCAERGLAVASLSFDMSVMDDLLRLMVGQTACIASEYEIHNPLAMAKFITENDIRSLAVTPSFMTNYLSFPECADALKNLHDIVVGAEAFPAALYRTLKEISPDMHVMNGYGPTECTITCCSKELTSDAGITIGGPTANTAFYVVDRTGNILPPFACGELMICGELVGRGYINLPEKTSASFVTLNGMPAYHSGDMVRFNADGEIEFFGRIDNQVKLRGFRVELDEIEAAICAFDGVRQSKVIVRNNGTEDYLAAFFAALKEIDIQALTDFLKSKLTYYMVPDVIMQLNSIPLTPSGKIDKKALPEIKREKKRSAKRAPKKSMEEQLCELFRSVLGLDEYYADDNFFEMGGTSLTASRVTMQLMSKNIHVEYQDIFDHPTPESLAEYIGAQSVEKAAVSKEEKTESETNWTDELLKNNTLQHAAEVERRPLGDVLLTGASGFLGIHVLKELLDLNEGKILCLVRKGDAASPEARLRNMLMYYFGTPYAEEFGTRILVYDADITDDDLPEKLNAVSYDTLINCAACVKHYAASDIIERINVHGVENLIRCARQKNARMIQISTTSVPGVHTEDTYRRRIKMHENELFVIDSMDNKYGISKYQAELRMLEAIRDGLCGKIIRVGNLMGRHSDGEFQINFNTNAFLNALRGFATIGKSPISHATDPMRFSPIDLTARAIVLLAGTNDCFTAFHADNRFGFDEMQLIDSCNRCGVTITPVDDNEYYADYTRMLGNDKVNARLQGLITNDRPDLHVVETSNAFTANILYRLGFSWPLPDEAYLDRVIKSLITLDYFAFDDPESLE